MTNRPEYHLTVREMLPEDRPRERLMARGAEYLSNAEILAILLRTGTKNESSLELAQKLLKGNGGLHFLARASADELGEIHGMGPAKVSQIKAAVELGRRIAAAVQWEHPIIKSPAEVVTLLGEGMRYLDREHFKCILLNTKNHVLGIDAVSVGSLNASLVHPRELFKKAIVKSAAGIILVHNHPSGDPEPSMEDRQVTQRMMQAGEIVGIEVLDHVVIGDGRYISFREQGLMDR